MLSGPESSELVSVDVNGGTNRSISIEGPGRVVADVAPDRALLVAPGRVTPGSFELGVADFTSGNIAPIEIPQLEASPMRVVGAGLSPDGTRIATDPCGPGRPERTPAPRRRHRLRRIGRAPHRPGDRAGVRTERRRPDDQARRPRPSRRDRVDRYRSHLQPRPRPDRHAPTALTALPPPWPRGPIEQFETISTTGKSACDFRSEHLVLNRAVKGPTLRSSTAREHEGSTRWPLQSCSTTTTTPPGRTTPHARGGRVCSFHRRLNALRRARREAKAQKLCDSCPVQAPCREHARNNHEYGYWAGESEEDRHLAGFTVSAPIGVRARLQQQTG